MTRLVLPADPRASHLFERLNLRYSHFLQGLPAPVRNLALRRSTYLGGPDDSYFNGVPELNPVLAATPWLYWETFCGLDDESFLAIAEAGTCLVLASIILDHIVDQQAQPLGMTALFHQALYKHGLTGFRAVFSSTSRFWDHFDRLAADHLHGLAEELESHDHPARLCFENLCTMAHGKVSPIITTLAALSEASNQAEVLEPIEASLKHIAVASQLLDDIGDWQHDMRVGHLTYYLAQLAPPEAWEQVEWPSLESLQAEVDKEWVDVEQLRLVRKWLDLSLKAVQNIACSGWVEYVEGYQSLTDQHMTQAVARHLARILRPLAREANTLDAP